MDNLEYKTERPAGEHSWFWSESDDGICFGGFETEEIAREAWWEEAGQESYKDYVFDAKEHGDEVPTEEAYKANHEFINCLRKPAITTQIFNSGRVLETFDDRNELAVYDEFNIDATDEAKNDLELMLADVLYRWCDKHNYWDHFRGLE